jgi:hypothetical protein
MKQRIIGKGLVVAVILLFLGLSIQPSVAVQTETDIEIEPKDYLFQTIIDIANNQDVIELLKQYKYDLFSVDIDRSVYRKLFFRNPRLLFNTLFTKPSLSVEYLDKCYNNGIEITDILGEDKTLETIENVEVTDTKLFDELNNIISKDEELSGRLEILKEINNELTFDPPLQDTIICKIGILIVVYEFMRLWLLSKIVNYLKEIFNEIPIVIELLFKIPMFFRGSIFVVTGVIIGLLGCFGFPPYIIN